MTGDDEAMDGWIDAPAVLWTHGLAAAAAVVLAGAQAVRRKGDPMHRTVGVLWVGLMLVVIVTSYGLRGEGGGFSWIHGLSVLALISMVLAMLSLRRGDTRAHGRWMSGAAIGLATAGVFTLLPNRIIGGWLFGNSL